MKSFVLKLIITLSLMGSIAYLAVPKADAVTIPAEQVELFDSCLELRASLVEFYLTLYNYAPLFDVSKYIVIYNRGVSNFNLLCTPMMSPLEEIE